MGGMLAFVYGVASYLIFLASCVYAIGFVGDMYVPRSVDAGPETPFGTALLVNTALLGIFAVQHSVMAREGFKRVWTRIIIQPVERITYVLVSSLLMLLLFWQWRPMPVIVWSVENTAAQMAINSLYILGWLLVILSTFLINHLDFLGLRQVYFHMRGTSCEAIGFKQPSIYKIVRHPIMLGFLIAFWAAPKMTVGHLLFAAASTGYILVGLWFEERDLVGHYGDAYRDYQKKVSMLIPMPRISRLYREAKRTSPSE